MDPLTLTILGGLASSVGAAALIGLAAKSPRLMRILKRRFLGRHFLVIGPKRTGKTSFYNFLRNDQFADTVPVRETLDISDRMSFAIDRGGDLKMDISAAFDIPGELPPKLQIELAAQKHPQDLIFFLSLADDSSEPWLKAACAHLRQAFSTDRRLGEKLQSLTVVFNKRDLVSQVEAQKQLESAREQVALILQPVMGENIKRIAFIACTLYENAGGEKSANEVLLAIISSATARKRLVKQ